MIPTRLELVLLPAAVVWKIRDLMRHARSIKIEITLALMLCTWGWGWDFISPYGQFLRAGRIKIFLLGSVAVAACHFAKTWHWTVGVLYFYIALIFVIQGMPTSGSLEMALITGTLFLIPELYRRIRREFFENTILATAALNAVIGFLQFFGIYPIFELTNLEGRGLPMGLIGQQTLLAPLLVFALCISLSRFIEARKAWKHFYASISILFLTVTILCGSTMGYASLLTAALVYVLFYKGMRTCVAVVAMAVLIGLAANKIDDRFSTLNGRLIPWTDAYHLIQDRPMVGYGLGSWAVLADRININRHAEAEAACKCNVHKWAPWTQLHMEPMQAQLEIGAIGTLLVFGFLLVLFLRSRILFRLKDQASLPYIAGLAALLVNCLANFLLHVSPHGQLIAYCAFVVLAKSKADS